MSSDNIQRKMDFIVEQQAKFTVDIQLLQEAQKQQSTNIDRLTADVQALTVDTQIMRSDIQTLGKIVQDGFNETREAINNLIIANEVTRGLSEEVARLAVKTSQRVTVLEERQ